MNWQNETPFFLKTRKRKCTSLHQFTLACSAGVKLSSSAQARSCWVKGCVEVKNVSSDSGVCTLEEHFPKLSPFSAPPGIGGELQKSVSVQACRGAGDGMGGWDLWWEFSSETLKIWNREKNRKEKEREREDFLTLELNSETVALRRNLIRGPEDNVSVLKKPGYCWKDV